MSCPACITPGAVAQARSHRAGVEGLAHSTLVCGSQWASESAHAPSACSSIQSADASIAATRLVRITHPFHPLGGKQLACVGERYTRSGRRLLLRVDEATICSVPPQWTDLVALD